MNPVVTAFIHKVLAEVHYKKVHKSIEAELMDHIESLKYAYIEEGLEENKAYEKAIEQMGEATAIGRQLHNTHKPRLEWTILLLVVGILGIGLLALYKWDTYAEIIQDVYYFKKQFIIAGVGVLAFIAMYFLPYQQLEKWSLVGVGIGSMLLIYLQQYGLAINGATRWLSLGGLSWNVPMTVLPLFVIAFVGIVRKYGKDKMIVYMVMGAMACIPIGLLMLNSFVNGLLLALMLVMIFTFYIISREFKGEKVKFLSVLYGTVFGGSLLLIKTFMSQPYRLERIAVFLDPTLDPLGAGYMPLNMQTIREAASLIGDRGFQTLSIQYLPEPAHDVILTFIIGSMGWLVAALLIGLVSLMLLRMTRASFKIQEQYGRLLAFSITLFFGVQLGYNIAMNLGVVPLVGMSLPFVSYGGTNLIVNMAMMGLFLSIYRRKDLVNLEVSKSR